MQRRLLTILTVALILTNVSTTLAQADTTIKKSKYHFWLGYGGQYFFSNNFHFLGGIQGNLNFSINQKHFIKLKGYVGISSDWDPLGPSDTTSPNRIIDIENLSLLYGIGKYQTKYFAIVPSAGISYGAVYWRGKYLYTEHGSGWLSLDNFTYEHDNYNYIGFPIEVCFVLTSPIVGLSLDIYANIHEHSDYGVALNMLLGKIRDKK
ncbi:MAG: hypothetical protein HY840_01805 [Bacteroidetes bacterium]|nr:hypothetical protein [Bacteroidota bacterium]